MGKLKKLARKYPKGSKKRNQIIHADQRFTERLKTLNTNQYQQIINRIQKGDKGNVKKIEKQSNRKGKWEMEFEGDLIHVIYDNRTKIIVTILDPPKERLIEFEERRDDHEHNGRPRITKTQKYNRS